jgi:purine-binding chemotaxis protein CheW
MDEAGRALLQQRARALARPHSRVARGEQLQVVTFVLAREVYAVESRYVIEVFRPRHIATLPRAQAPVFGVTAWRGDLLTVFDLRPVLGLPAAGLDDLGRVVVLGRERPAFGLLVDAVCEVVALAASDVRELPDGVAVRRDLLRGVADRTLLVLDGEKLLNTYV